MHVGREGNYCHSISHCKVSLHLVTQEREINLLKEKLEQSEKQLKIQTKVNEEVKRLLVASVGEDIEARVDFLTQDKARLAADVMQYRWP